MFLKFLSSIVIGDVVEIFGKFEFMLNSGYLFKDNFEWLF